jgi:hypothetical protein
VPVDFLSATQIAAYGRYGEAPSARQLERFFHFDDRDRELIADRRGDHNRLGFAVQLATVRFLGTFLAHPAEVPSAVAKTVARELAITDLDNLAGYAPRESGDAEQHLLDQLATIKRAVADGVGRAPNLNALRNVIGQLFESVELVEWTASGDPHAFADFCEAWDAVAGFGRGVFDANGGPTYVLLPRLRSTPSPTGQLMPVGSIEQYPPSDANPFFARYCWW